MPKVVPSHPSNRGDIYVGYLPVPRSYRRFLLGVVPAILVLLCVTGVVWSFSHDDPGSGRWHDAAAIELRGTIHMRPYPMIVSSDQQGNVQTTLLVRSGKHGAAEHAAHVDHQAAIAIGTLLERNGPRILELSEGESSIVPDHDNDPGSTTPEVDQGQVTLRGEIVDSKCFVGAMKPGNGKTHKACATLCIRGGIPPALVVRSTGDSVDYYLLAAPDGGPVGEWIYPLIADPVEISGRLSRRGDLSILHVAPESVHRL